MIHKDALVIPDSRMRALIDDCPSHPHQITIQPQTARQDGRWLLARHTALYYRLRQRSPVPVGVILQPLSPVATPASLGSALPYIPLNPAVEPPMSLTRELNKKQSPFRQLVEGCAPALAIAGGRSPEGKRVAERLGFYDLVKSRSLAPLPDGVTDARRHSPTVGTAFDIRTRMMLGEFEPRRSASAMGMDVFNHLLAPLLPNGQHISDVLATPFSRRSGSPGMATTSTRTMPASSSPGASRSTVPA